MLLCVDVGNTQIALGLYEDDAPDDPHPPLVRDWRMRTDRRITADELEVAFGGLLGRYADKVTGVAALSTVPSLLRELKLLIDRRGDPAVVVGPGVRTGVPLLVDTPREGIFTNGAEIWAHPAQGLSLHVDEDVLSTQVSSTTVRTKPPS